MSLKEQFIYLIEDPVNASRLMKLGLIIVLVLASLYSIYQWFIVDDLAELKRLRHQEIRLKTIFKEKHNQAYLLPFYRVQLQEIQNMFGEMIKTLPKQTEVPGLILDISEVAVANGLRIQVFEPKAEVMRKFYAEKPIFLKATGSYQQLASFASDLAILPRIVSLHNIELSPLQPKSTQQNTHSPQALNSILEMQAIVKTFRYLAKEARL